MPRRRLTAHLSPNYGELTMCQRKVEARIHYSPLHTIPLYANKFPTSLPNTDWIGARVMTLPISASMNLDDTDYVIGHLAELMR